MYKEEINKQVGALLHDSVIKHTIFEIRTDFEINKYKYQRG